MALRSTSAISTSSNINHQSYHRMLKRVNSLLFRQEQAPPFHRPGKAFRCSVRTTPVPNHFFRDRNACTPFGTSSVFPCSTPSSKFVLEKKMVWIVFKHPYHPDDYHSVNPSLFTRTLHINTKCIFLKTCILQFSQKILCMTTATCFRFPMFWALHDFTSSSKC